MRRISSVLVIWTVIPFLLVGCKDMNNQNAQTTAASGTAQVTPLKLTLTLDRSVYGASDEIWATLFLENVGDRPILVNKRMLMNAGGVPELMREVEFVFIDPEGKGVPFLAMLNVGFPKPKDFVELRPNSRIEHKYNLRKYYGPYLPGNYSVKGVYQNTAHPDDTQVAWTGRVESNIAEFTIEP